MKCPNCRHENQPGAKFCEECAAPLPRTCTNCGALLREAAKFCPECANPVASGPVSASTTDSPRLSPGISPPPHLAQKILSARGPLEGERRQLTVMFCDLVDSTALAQRLDPEELRDLMQAYQRTCGQIVERYAGHVAQYLGDGLMVYFGWPKAHEDDAVRAVRAGLEVTEAVSKLTAPVPMSARVGIHTGLVVVGETGQGDASTPKAAVGETPNIAARLQALAEPGSVVVSERTQALAAGLFEFAALGAQPLKGISEPVRLSRVVGARASESRFEAVHSGVALTPLVGRDEEAELLLRRWARAKAGEGQVVLVGGEPGVGKSRLTRVLRERLGQERYMALRYQCSPFYVNSALYPVIEHLERAAGLTREHSAEQKLDKLQALLVGSTAQMTEAAPLYAALLSLHTERHPPLNLSPQKQKEKTLDALIGQVEALAQRQPVLMVFEDVQWIDPSSQELLDLFLPRLHAHPILLLITYRPEYSPAWVGQPNVTSLTLNRLSRRQSAELVAKLTGGKGLPLEVFEQLLAHTDGVPLFVEELTKSVLESGLLREEEDRYTLKAPLPALAIPTTLRDSLIARLDRLAPVKEIAQIGACIGREFSYELLSALSPLQGVRLTEALEQLTQAGLVFRRGAPPDSVYTFKHALVQDAAYDSLLKTKRIQLHTQIARVLEERFPAVQETEPETLAHHYTAAGLSEAAVAYWRKAAERALHRSASVEAVAHLTKGLDALRGTPDSPERCHRELNLLTALGPALMATKGFASPEVEKAYSQALALCRQVGDTARLFSALRGLWELHELRAELKTARELAEQLLAVAQGVQDPALLLVANDALGDTLLWLGEFVAAWKHIEDGIAIYDPKQHHSLALVYGGYDPGIACRNFAAHALWYLGYPDQALQKIREAIALARKLSHPFSLAFALIFAAWLHQYRRESVPAQELANEAVTLCREQDIGFFIAHGTILRGWALLEHGQGQEGIAEIREGLRAYRATGAELERPHWLALLAEACGAVGQAEEGLAVLDEALTAVGTHGVRFCEAELYRLRGDLLLKHSSLAEDEAERCLHRALGIAQGQRAKSLELRAARSIAYLWRQQGRVDDARRILAEVYGWFTEGFDATDLSEARALIGA
jgi:class 3 adenylate cyclase/predicted ATPase